MMSHLDPRKQKQRSKGGPAGSAGPGPGVGSGLGLQAIAGGNLGRLGSLRDLRLLQGGAAAGNKPPGAKSHTYQWLPFPCCLSVWARICLSPASLLPLSFLSPSSLLPLSFRSFASLNGVHLCPCP